MNWPPLRRADDDPRRRRFRKGIYLLPSLFTTLNMALGYYALYHAIQGSVAEPWHYDNAAKAIGFAIIFDGLDGKIARMTNTESDFGREFDSLADVITFGVAPAILAWMWGFRILAPLNGSDLLARVVHLGAIATFAFLIACRLGRTGPTRRSGRSCGPVAAALDLAWRQGSRRRPDECHVAGNPVDGAARPGSNVWCVGAPFRRMA